jgi:magnesium and cobalt transporter
MSDDQSHSSSEAKSWIERLGQFLAGEPEDRQDLIEVLRDAQKRRLIEPEALSMIEGVLQMSELRVRDVMIPRAQMVVVPQDAELETLFPLIIETAHSRYPVIGEDRAEVVGVLLVKDLFAQGLRNPGIVVRSLMRQAQFVPESKRLNILLREFRSTRNHMAIVVDEYGGAAGLVTIEDVLEQIVGDIVDEYDFDNEEEYILRRGENEYHVKALMPVEDFNDYFGASLPDNEFDTIGGLIVHQAGRVPKRGDKICLGHFRFDVMRADNRRCHLFKLRILDAPEADSPAG